jgi:hypothetical protein
LVPEIAMPVTVIAILLPLVTVTDCGEVVDPTVVLAKVRLDGDTVTLPVTGMTPVPDRLTW